MDVSELEAKRLEFMTANEDEKVALRAELAEMEKAFQGRGDLGKWTPEVLKKIDEIFVKHYKIGEEVSPMLFFPDCGENYNKFLEYCDEVDQVLRLNASGAPPYAREYFAYYSIWQMRGFRFPVPLG